MKRFLLKTIRCFTKVFLLIVIFILSNNFLVAQTCGVEAKFHIAGNGGTSDPYNDLMIFDSQYSTFQTNWIAYNRVWRWDGQVSSGISITETVGSSEYPGIHEMCLTVYARNTITGDSCFDTYCHIYNSVGLDNFYGTFNAQQDSGNSYSFLPDCYGANWFTGYNCYVYEINYGDGTIDGMPNAPYTHTYATSGDYAVTFYFDIFISVPITRVIHVNNGIPNIQCNPVWAVWDASPNPDQIDFSVYTTPPFSAAGAGGTWIYPYPSYTPPVYGITNGNMYSFDSMPAPGQYIIKAPVQDTSGGTGLCYGFVIVGTENYHPDTITGIVFYDNDADGIMDTNDYGIPGKEIKAYYNFYSTYTDSNGYYSILIPHKQILLSLMNYAPYQITLPSGSGYSHNYNSGTLHPNFNFGLTNVNVHLCGKVYIDYNQDSVYSSATDAALKLATVHAHDSITGQDFQINVDNNGDYCIDLPAGNFTVWATTYLLDSSYCVPDSFKLDTVSGNFQNINFGFNSIQTGANLSVTLYDFGNPRPGFSYGLAANVRNTGIDSTQGTIQINYNNIPLALTSLTPAGGIIDSINHTVTWTTGVMHAAAVKYFSMSFMVPITTPLGTPLSSLAVVTADSGYVENNLQNNSYGEYAVVVGSFDPNDKVVSPTGYNASGGVPTNQRLYYRINFQNTGTASALNVIVQDQIDSNLDMNTFIMERASHSYKMVSNDRTVTWKFLNINLPDSNTNEPLSHGFIEYSIIPTQGLPNGVVIPNTANIYFDFNAPVATNTVTNTITDCSQLQLATVLFSNSTLCKNDTLAATAALAFPMQTAWYVDGVFVGNGLTISTDTLSAGNHLIEMTSLNSVCTQTISQTVFVDEPVKPTFNANGNLLTSSSVINNQWYLNGSSIVGATQNTFTISQSGWYVVAVTDSFGCVAFSDSVWVSPVGIEELQARNVFVSPNPFKEEFTVYSLQFSVGYNVKVIDMLGKEIFISSSVKGNLKINTATWAKGVYNLRIVFKDAIVRKKIVKQ